MPLTALDREFFKRAMRLSSAKIKSESPDDIVVRCPICGDSTKSKSKARLHLYGKYDLPLVNCFNGDCPVNNIPLGKFLKEYYPTLAEEYKKRQFAQNIEDFKGDVIPKTDSTLWNNLDEPTENVPQGIKRGALTKFNLSQYFKKAEDVPAVLEYLSSRGFDAVSLCKEFKFYYSDSDIEINSKQYSTNNSIVIPLTLDGDWIGFYSRNIETKSFATYMPECNSGFKVWNLFNVDVTEPVYIFEGIFDALAAYDRGLKNVIACMGATVPDKILEQIPKAVLCYDNDKTGITNTIKALKMHMRLSALVYDNATFKDMNEALQQGVDIGSFIKYNTHNGIQALIKLQSRL